MPVQEPPAAGAEMRRCQQRVPEFLEDSRFNEETKRKILNDNATAFYRIS